MVLGRKLVNVLDNSTKLTMAAVHCVRETGVCLANACWRSREKDRRAHTKPLSKADIRRFGSVVPRAVRIRQMKAAKAPTPLARGTRHGMGGEALKKQAWHVVVPSLVTVIASQLSFT